MSCPFRCNMGVKNMEKKKLTNLSAQFNLNCQQLFIERKSAKTWQEPRWGFPHYIHNLDTIRTKSQRFLKNSSKDFFLSPDTPT